jgi:acyl CoA:acetate/3-ketoacid CoA transferase alpha subunit
VSVITSLWCKPDASGQPKETREYWGRRYVLEEAIRGDFALVKAQAADKVPTIHKNAKGHTIFMLQMYE